MFTMSPAEAKAFDNKSAFIDSAGKYKGTIVSAEYVNNFEKGSQNIVLTFKSDTGQMATFWLNMIYNGNEKNETNHKLLSAILACLRLRDTGQAQATTINKWDRATRTEKPTQVQAFVSLHGKRIGLILQMEISKTSEDGFARPVIYAPFDYESERVATEILSQAPAPVLLSRLLEKAMERPLIDRRQNNKPAKPNNGGFGDYNKAVPEFIGQGNQADPFDDDIPF